MLAHSNLVSEHRLTTSIKSRDLRARTPGNYRSGKTRENWHDWYTGASNVRAWVSKSSSGPNFEIEFVAQSVSKDDDVASISGYEITLPGTDDERCGFSSEELKHNMDFEFWMAPSRVIVKCRGGKSDKTVSASNVVIDYRQDTFSADSVSTVSSGAAIDAKKVLLRNKTAKLLGEVRLRLDDS